MTEPFKIRKAPGKWSVRSGGAILGETTSALELSEGDNVPVIYFPRADIAMAFLDPSETAPRSDAKGDASYYSIVNRSSVTKDAAWSYETPTEAAAALAGYIAFDVSDSVKVEQI